MTATKTRKRKAAIPVVENIINDQTKVFTDAPIGTRQGDLYFVRIQSLPASAKVRANRQLADGNTQGSRHVCKTGKVFDADRGEVAEMIRRATGANVEITYIGPVFEVPAYVEHPEHGDHDFQCEGVYAVAVQRSRDGEERDRRVAD